MLLGAGEYQGDVEPLVRLLPENKISSPRDGEVQGVRASATGQQGDDMQGSEGGRELMHQIARYRSHRLALSCPWGQSRAFCLSFY